MYTFKGSTTLFSLVFVIGGDCTLNITRKHKKKGFYMNEFLLFSFLSNFDMLGVEMGVV